MKKLLCNIDFQLLSQIFRFGIVGVAATLTHYLIAIVCHEQLFLNLYVANLLGYCTAVGVSFVGHSKFTFRVETSVNLFSKFVVVSLSALVLSELLLLVLENSFRFSHRVSMLLVVFTVPAFTFVLSRLWVYKHAGS